MSRGYLTKQNIFDEAVRLFSEKDYKVVTLKEISKGVGISEAAIYRHYDNKAQILDEILDKLKIEVNKYILTEHQIDRYIEIENPFEILGHFIKLMDIQCEDYTFIIRAYRIMCMEYLTNGRAMEILENWFYDSIVKSIQYTLTKMIEKNMIVKCNISEMSILWIDFLFSGTVKKMLCVGEKGNYDVWYQNNKVMSKYLIRLTIEGKTYFEEY